MSNINLSKTFYGSILGGFVGAVFMDIILVATKVMMGMAPLADFMVMGTFVGGSAGTTILAGAIAHHLVGIVTGAIFGLSIYSLGKNYGSFNLNNYVKGLGLGLLFGVILYIVLFLPLAMFGFKPIMVDMMGADMAMALMPMIMNISFIEHIVFGATVGLLVVTVKT